MNKTFCDLLLPDLDVGTWVKGEEVLPKVLEVSKTVFGWQAIVEGQDEPFYEVNFFVGENGEWGCECNCGHFEIRGRTCKHLIAVARLIDERGE